MNSEVINVYDSVNIRLPLFVQIAQRIVKRYHIKLVEKHDLKTATPFFYSSGKFIEDFNFERIKGFITSEIVEIFNSPKEKINKGFIYINGYIVPKSDINKYLKSHNYLNVLAKNIIENITSINQIRVNEDNFDDEDYVINTKNGILDLRTGILEKHNTDKLIRCIVNAEYIGPIYDSSKMVLFDFLSLPDIRRNIFINLLFDSLYDKEINEIENIKRVQSFLEILSTYLIGNNKLKIATIIIGERDTGKSTLFDVIKNVFNDYATPFNKSVITSSYRGGKEIRPDILSLAGKRLLLSSETDKTDKFNTADVKAIAGNDNMTFRKPHKGDMINIKIKGKLLLGTNYCPSFSNLDDDAFLKRMIMIDFKNTPNVLDRSLQEKMLSVENRNFIFTILTDIAKYVITKEGPFIVESFLKNKQRILINQNNSIALFFKEHIRERNKNNKLQEIYMLKHPVKLIYNVLYIPFCIKNNIEHEKYEAFAKDFKELASEYPMIVWKKGKNNNYYIGIDVIGENRDRYYSIMNNESVYEMCGLGNYFD